MEPAGAATAMLAVLLIAFVCRPLLNVRKSRIRAHTRRLSEWETQPAGCSSTGGLFSLHFPVLSSSAMATPRPLALVGTKACVNDGRKFHRMDGSTGTAIVRTHSFDSGASGSPASPLPSVASLDADLAEYASSSSIDRRRWRSLSKRSHRLHKKMCHPCSSSPASKTRPGSTHASQVGSEDGEVSETVLKTSQSEKESPVDHCWRISSQTDPLSNESAEEEHENGSLPVLKLPSKVSQQRRLNRLADSTSNPSSFAPAAHSEPAEMSNNNAAHSPEQHRKLPTDMRYDCAPEERSNGCSMGVSHPDNMKLGTPCPTAASKYEMTSDELQKLMSMRAEIERWKHELSAKDLIFASDPCLVRYLRARKWDVNKATDFFFKTLKFRHKYRPEQIKWSQVAHEAKTGKIYRMYKDKQGRPVLLMRPGYENSNDAQNQIRYFIYCMEHCILQMDTNDTVARGSNTDLSPEQITWLVDFDQWTPAKAVPLKVALEIKEVLQNGYPERLGTALFWNPPRLFESSYKMIAPFIDPETRSKIHFVRWNEAGAKRQKIEEHFNPKFVERRLGGDLAETFVRNAHCVLYQY